MSRALVAVFKSATMAEVDRRNLTSDEAARALVDLARHYASKASPFAAAALAVVLADMEGKVADASEWGDKPHE